MGSLSLSSVLMGGTQWGWGSLTQSGAPVGVTQWIWGGSLKLCGVLMEGSAPLPAGDGLVAPGQPYWPGEFVTTASESEGHGGSETLRVEPAGGEGPLRGEPPRLNGEALPRDPLLLPLPHPHKGTGRPAPKRVL